MSEREQRGEPRGGGARPTAAELRERFAWLERFTDEELRRITIRGAGEPAEPDELYVDISHPERGVVRGEDVRTIPEGAAFVGRSGLGDALWEKLGSEGRP